MGILRSGFTVAFLALSGLLALAPPSAAASLRQDAAPVTFAITAARGDVVEGERLYWQITINPHGRQLEDVEVAPPADPQSWQVAGGQIIRFAVFTATTTFPVSAVPLQSGNLRPQLLIRFTRDGQRQDTTVSAETFVHVVPLTEPLQAEIVAERATIREGDFWRAQVLLRNTSPFILTGLSLRGLGTDLGWKTVLSVADLPPRATGSASVTATVTGDHPQPVVTLDYSWQDMAARPHQSRLLVRGQVLAIAEPWPRWLEPFRPYAGAAVGALLGLIVSLATLYAGEHLRERLRHRSDQAHVRGLLRLCVLQARGAAERSLPVPMEPIEAVYLGERGLYALARELKMQRQVADLYAAATTYNTGLTHPGGAAQRLERLKAETDALSKALGDS